MSHDVAARVDVVIPTVGRPTLLRAVESVLAQTVPANVYVVAASRDAMRAAHAVLAPCSATPTVIEGDGWGPGRSRNEGMHAGSAQFVAFLDDDDWWEPPKLATQLGVMDADAEAPMSFTDSFFRRPDSTTRVPLRHLENGADLLDFILSRRRLRYGDGFIQSSSLLVRRPLAEVVSWDETLAKHEDWDFVVRVCRQFGHPIHVRQALVHVPQGSAGSLSEHADPQGSIRWLHSVSTHRSREVGDFLASEVLRGHLRRRDVHATVQLLPELLRARPHLAAVAVGLSGLLR